MISLQEHSLLLFVCLCVQVHTDLPIVSGSPFLELDPGHTPYVLSVTPWKQGKQTGLVSPASYLSFFTDPVHNALMMLFDVFSNFHTFVLWVYCALPYVRFEHLLSYIYVYICSSVRFSWFNKDSKDMTSHFSCRICVISTLWLHARSRQRHWWA